MHVIWARGQEPGNYIHSPKSGIESKDESASNPEFYQADELKYHGHKSQRGVTQINFFDEIKPSVEFPSHELDNPCKGHWRHPRTCKPENFDCEYYAEWESISEGLQFRFKIQTTHTNLWTGIGFSNDREMSQTDAILGMLDKNGRPFFMDTWINGYTKPQNDLDQNIRNETGRVINGSLILEFVRDRATGDKKVTFINIFLLK